MDYGRMYARRAAGGLLGGGFMGDDQIEDGGGGLLGRLPSAYRSGGLLGVINAAINGPSQQEQLAEQLATAEAQQKLAGMSQNAALYGGYDPLAAPSEGGVIWAQGRKADQDALLGNLPQPIRESLLGVGRTNPEKATELAAAYRIEQAKPPKALDPKDRYVNVQGVGLVDIGGEKPQVAVGVPQTPREAPTTPEITEYRFALQNGFRGSFMDYQAAKRQQTGGAPATTWSPDPTNPSVQISSTGERKAIPRDPQEEEAEKRAKNARATIALLDEIDPVRAGPMRKPSLIDQATGSGVGAAVDWLGGLVGATPDGAAEAQQLKMIEGQLIMMMPRMEGPQSNMDQQLYRDMAGQLGDPTVPAERKRAAAQMLRRLNEKYAAPAVGASGPTTPPAAPQVAQAGSEPPLSPDEQAELAELRRRLGR